jgi:hypothetical protein
LFIGLLRRRPKMTASTLGTPTENKLGFLS